ncbi:MAG: hypothetical protein R3318_05640 [Gammaproteobacteria bacterium]|nr:hypothetical protein [Gammaproteobacteria bacterium]
MLVFDAIGRKFVTGHTVVQYIQVTHPVVMKIHLIIGLLFTCSLPVQADQCPTPAEVRERTITRDYDWSVGEDVTLDMLLEVSELRKVELNNHGEFVACHYLSRQLPVRMDGAAPGPGCYVDKSSSEWLSLPGGTLSCTETELNNCRFTIVCINQVQKDR